VSEWPTPAGPDRLRLMRSLLLAASVALALQPILFLEALSQGPPLAVQGQQGLGFGEIPAGIDVSIAPQDPIHAGRFRIRGSNRTVQLSFLLPSSMSSAEGGAIALQFGPNDAGFSATDSPGDMAPFDPTAPHTVRLTGPWSGVFLGGMARPPGNTPPGVYGGLIVLTVADLGS